jgi:hypothetical protein
MLVDETPELTEVTSPVLFASPVPQREDTET